MGSSVAAVHRVIVSVSELDTALPLYGTVLGLSVTSRAGDVVRLASAGGVEVLLHRRPPVPSDTAVAVGFVVDRLDETVGDWAGHGGSIVDPPAAQPWGERTAVVRDADGHLVCLVQAA